MEKEIQDIYENAIVLVAKEQQVSSSLFQKKMGIGYSKAGMLVEQLEKDGYIGEFKGAKKRDVHLTWDEENEKVIYPGNDCGKPNIEEALKEVMKQNGPLLNAPLIDPFVKWEYKTLGINDEDVDELNELGEEGWEVCGMGYNPVARTSRFILKRPKYCQVDLSAAEEDCKPPENDDTKLDDDELAG